MKTLAVPAQRETQRVPAALVDSPSTGGGLVPPGWTPALDDSPRQVAQRRRLPGASDEPVQCWPTGDAMWDAVIGGFLLLVLAWLIQDFFARPATGGARKDAAKKDDHQALPETLALARDIQPAVQSKIEADADLRAELLQAVPQQEDEAPAAVQPVLEDSPALAQIVEQVLEEAEPVASVEPVEPIEPVEPVEPVEPGLAEPAADTGASLVEEELPSASTVTRGRGRGGRGRPAGRGGKRGQRRSDKSAKTAEKLTARSQEDESPPRSSLSAARTRTANALKADLGDAELLSDWAGPSDAPLWRAFTTDSASFEIGCEVASRSKASEFLAWCRNEELPGAEESPIDYVLRGQDYLVFVREARRREEHKAPAAKVEVRKSTLSSVQRHWPKMAYTPPAGLSKGTLSVATSTSGGGMVLLKGLTVELEGGAVPAHVSLPADASGEGTFNEGHLKVEGGQLLNQYFFGVSGGKARKLSNSPTVPTNDPGKWEQLPANVWTSVKALVEHLASADNL